MRAGAWHRVRAHETKAGMHPSFPIRIRMRMDAASSETSSLESGMLRFVESYDPWDHGTTGGKQAPSAAAVPSSPCGKQFAGIVLQTKTIAANDFEADSSIRRAALSASMPPMLAPISTTLPFCPVGTSPRPASAADTWLQPRASAASPGTSACAKICST